MKKLSLFALLFLFFFSTVVSASDVTFPYKVHITHPTNSDVVVYLYSTSPITSDGNGKFFTTGTYQWNNGGWTSPVETGSFSLDVKALGSIGSSVYHKDLISANHDIFYEGTSNVFFSPPVQSLITVEEMSQSSLGNLMKDFGQALATLLPIGLVISSMVLALYLVRRFLPLFGLSSK